eukprot:Blabericola_migrator_1__1198@NODE_1306_length_4845_cov_216_545626_g74_i1_p4_GENE_NODE_1306_length_4845_cov_216_545626_g74_i1NODE_1306_length_4845_cov_216_545626_g74_i1_p4_ORF_typecomplete_len197_score58_20Ran_BP1/PF00638_18/1_2e37WH1/PF00568_23/0_0031SH3_10/PF17902_1/78SH3_10/PF17902_1/0_7DUF4303/PF14136_6/0_39DUF4303/PF14136_6/2_2e03_NODE_1306_length_4845_cov_216_545626_g74_i119962586
MSTTEKETVTQAPATEDAGTPETAEQSEKAPAPAVGGGNDDGPEEEEEVTQGNWNLPQVDLKEVEVVTGEEGEECVWKHRSKLYRWSNGEWKERGLGDSKLLRDKDGKTRFLLRQEKTGKIVANHYVVPKNDQCQLKPNAGSDKCYVWSVLDSAEDEPKVEQFALMFGQAENAQKFKEQFEAVGAENVKLIDAGKF